MGAATLPPWLTPWSSGLVYSPRAYKPGERLRAERPHPRLTIFTYGHSNNAPLLRFGSWPEEGTGGAMSAGSPPPGPGPAAPQPAPPGGMHWERVPLDRAPWHLEVPVPDRAQPPYDITSHSDEDMFPEEGAGGGSAGTLAAVHAYGSVVRGWAAGAALLALLVLLVRVGERLLDWKIVLRRRRLHRERQRARANAGALAAGAGPPPYSACARAGGAAGVAVRVAGGAKAGAGPPPPYRAGKAPPGGAAPHRIARLLQACGMRLERDGARPPPAVLSSGFGVITYYAMDWATESLIAQGDMTPADPPPVYSTADPAPAAPDAARAGADAPPGWSPRRADAAPSDRDADPLGAGAEAAPKDVYIDV